MRWYSLAALVAPAQAALRFGCSTLTIQRLDPIVDPGRVPSAHLHQIVGGNAFNATMVGDVGERGSCTTCTFTEDFSNYWTAVMMFKAANGTYKRVPIMQNGALPNGINGGMTVWALPSPHLGTRLTVPRSTTRRNPSRPTATRRLPLSPM